MDYQYIKESYDIIYSKLLDSMFSINATIYIQAREIGQESFENLYGDVLDARQVDMVKKAYPLDLKPFYRISMFPMEKSGLRLNITQQTQYNPGSKLEPYDIWVSVFEDKIKVRQNSTLLDFADKIEIENNIYEIKGLIRDIFGNKPVYHIFLVKETEK